VEEQTETPIATNAEARSVLRRPYAPPKAAFVPLKLEERLLTIGYSIETCLVT
jgi:hypothetical protein